MTLADCVSVAAGNAEFVSNWMRLHGITLAGSPIDAMVDEASGRNDAIAAQFIADVKELIYDRIPRGRP
jgi:hypothetical protein